MAASAWGEKAGDGMDDKIRRSALEEGERLLSIDFTFTAKIKGSVHQILVISDHGRGLEEPDSSFTNTVAADF